MPLELSRPLVFFDLETTGTKVEADRIVQISLLKLFPNGNEEVSTHLVNPGISIPHEATAIHGISDADVQNSPTFQDLSNTIYDFLINCDVAGYNIRGFDLPLLRFEFYRIGINYDVSNIQVVDAMIIFKKKEKRDLSAAYKFYCNRELEGAHDAEIDIRATKEVLLSQVDKYDDIGTNLEEIATYSQYEPYQFADISGKLRYNENGELIFAFGNHLGERVVDNLDYVNWMETREFPIDTMAMIRAEMNRRG